MSSRIAPSERMQQQIEQLLKQGLNGERAPVSELLRLAAQRVMQQALEEEARDFLGRERYERAGETKGYRNGYKPGKVRSAEGELALGVPQVRGSEPVYHSRLMDFLRGNTDVLEYLVTQMYVRGLSTRDV